MNLPLRFLVALSCIVSSVAVAQSPGGNPAADQAWVDLTALHQSAATTVLTGEPKTAARGQAEQQRAQKFRQTAQSAKDFYTPYPEHPDAPQARKLEALAALQGTTKDDPVNASAALAVAQRYRTDPANRAENRFDVALLSERLQLSRRLDRPLFFNHPIELEKIATGLRREFGDLPGVHRFYASVARSADMRTADRIAQLEIASPAPAEVKAEARAILERRNLLGRPLNLAVPATDGTVVDLARHNDRPTVVFFYSAANNPGSLVAPKRFLKTPVADCRWVYVAVNSTAPQVSAAKARAPFPGTHCALTAAEAAPLLDRLRHRHFPYVYVVNRQGLLTGFGPIDELPGLVWDANR